MPTCPVCGHENADGALVCAQCYSLLSDVTISSRDSTLPRPMQASKTDVLSTHPHGDPKDLEADAVALYFDYLDEPLIVRIRRHASLGRRTLDATFQPRIDLSPYEAYSKGVSRLHAILRRTAAGLTIEDQASRNGTWVNGQRLEAFRTTPLNSGDHILLAKLSFEIYFR
jgi:pSer/pThr/pTyr-binding forkhead associated (FHA) protein